MHAGSLNVALKTENTVLKYLSQLYSTIMHCIKDFESDFIPSDYPYRPNTPLVQQGSSPFTS